MTFPQTLEYGNTWDPETIVMRDYEFKAFCRCTDADYSEGLSVCNWGCGDPTTICDESFGCDMDDKGCNSNQCTCLPDPDLVADDGEKGAMTY